MCDHLANSPLRVISHSREVVTGTVLASFQGKSDALFEEGLIILVQFNLPIMRVCQSCVSIVHGATDGGVRYVQPSPGVTQGGWYYRIPSISLWRRDTRFRLF